MKYTHGIIFIAEWNMDYEYYITDKINPKQHNQ